MAGLGLIHVRPAWAEAGVLPVLAGLAAAALLWRPVGGGAFALALDDLAHGRPSLPWPDYQARARHLAPALAAAGGLSALLQAAALPTLGCTTLLWGGWALAATPFAATGVADGRRLLAGQGGRAVAVLLLLDLGLVGLALNLAVAPYVAIAVAGPLFAVDLTWWGRLVSPTHIVFVELAAVLAWWLMAPIRQVVAALFALDLRVRREGLELARLVDAAAYGDGRHAGRRVAA